MMCVPTAGVVEDVQVFEAEGVELLHIDVMDGVFVPNLMLGTNYVQELRELSDIPLDLHLMIDEPGPKLDWFDIQPDEWVSVHAEATVHLQRTVLRIRSLGAHPRVALNPATPLSALDWVLDDLDWVLVMTVNPGYAGQKLIPQMIGKIEALAARLASEGRNLDIEVDGNVSVPNAIAMAAAGATTFVLGTSALFRPSDGLVTDLREFRRSIAKPGRGVA